MSADRFDASGLWKARSATRLTDPAIMTRRPDGQTMTPRGDPLAAKFSTHHIPDDGVRFAPGDVVSLVHAAGRVQIIHDPHGEYVVTGCRPATEYHASALLRVDLKKPERRPADAGAFPSWSSRDYQP